MDFYLIVVFLFGGILLGFKFGGIEKLLKIAEFITRLGLIVLLLTMGANLGSNQAILHQLAELGLEALIFALVSILFSVIALVLLADKLGLNEFAAVRSGDSAVLETDSAADNLSILIFGSVIIGILIGYFFLSADQQILLDKLSNYSLALLLFGVGTGLGAHREVFSELKLVGWKVLLLPLLIAFGSLFGSVLIGLVLGFTTGEAAAVGAGFGWYSLSGVLIAKLHSAELGSLAFLTNVFRELLTVILLPFVARKFGNLAVIAPGGATTMDVTLPLVKETGGEEVVLPAFISGAILSSLVPILVPLFLHI